MKVVVVAAAMMEVMVMMVMFMLTAVMMETNSPGPRVSQTSNILPPFPCLAGRPWEVRRGRD